MDTAKLKNIVILILLAVNVFLLLAVGRDSVTGAASERAAFAGAVEAVENSGISVSEAVKHVETPAVYSVSRDLSQEKKKMDALLGKSVAADLGGNIRFYDAGTAQASLRGTGEIDVLYLEETVERGQSPEKTVEKLMKKLSLRMDADAVSVRQEGESTVLEAGCLWEGCPVYNVSLRFTFSDEALMMISGTRLFDSETAASPAALDDLAALLRFVEVTREEGFVCRSLLGLEVGYLMSVSLSGESTLTPVWHFTTDTGDLYINAVSGRTETLG